MLFEQNTIKLRNKIHFMDNKTELMQHFLQMQQISVMPKYTNEFLGVFSYLFVYMQMHEA